MKRLGFRHTRGVGPGHQECEICHPHIKNGKKRSRKNKIEEFDDQTSVTEMEAGQVRAEASEEVRETETKVEIPRVEESAS